VESIVNVGLSSKQFLVTMQIKYDSANLKKKKKFSFLKKYAVIKKNNLLCYNIYYIYIYKKATIVEFLLSTIGSLKLYFFFFLIFFF
jgi:hypothetical protein